INYMNIYDGSPLNPQLGPYFSDGRRRVDYVLAYHIQKPSGIRRQSSRFGDTNFIRRLRRSLSMRSSRAPLQPKEDPEITAQEQRTDYHEDDKRFRREEFEENLLETGLELEKDDGCKIPGIGFLKIHAPWNVLCREAEFMKLKMPTKKVYDVKQGSNLVEKIRLFIHKVTAPLHPKVDANRPDSVKSLSHPFSREKQHLHKIVHLFSTGAKNTLCAQRHCYACADQAPCAQCLTKLSSCMRGALIYAHGEKTFDPLWVDTSVRHNLPMIGCL
uniref:Anoctamin dimerisation domain-containing protein n=1 Tax=Acanthochromis polyacanthus TaxID=80966 RepID=A0A3Q1FXX8_9TELE